MRNSDEVRFIDGVEKGKVDAYVRTLLAEAELPSSMFTLPREYLSVSQVTMYQRCPRQYYFRYIEDIVAPPGAALVEGSAMHRALEHALRAKQRKDILPVDTLVDVFRTVWKETEDIIYGENEDENQIINRSRTFLSQYRDKHLPKIEPLEIEKHFVAPFVEGIPVVGFIDLIDAGEEDSIETVVDHKISGRMKSQFEVDNDMQLTLYAHVMRLPKVRFDVFLKNKKPDIRTVRALRTPEHVRWAKRVFLDVAEAITRGNFPPCDPKNYMCRPQQCGYYQRCREAVNV